MTSINHVVAAPGGLAPSGPYSLATVGAGLCFVSCQLGVDPDTGELASGFDAQSTQALDNVGAVLEAAGSSWPQVMSTTVLLSDVSLGEAFNRHYRACFPTEGPFPARAIYQAGALAPGALVGVAVVALA